jgi:hypothetical protein
VQLASGSDRPYAIVRISKAPSVNPKANEYHIRFSNNDGDLKNTLFVDDLGFSKLTYRDAYSSYMKIESPSNDKNQYGIFAGNGPSSSIWRALGVVSNELVWDSSYKENNQELPQNFLWSFKKM